MGPANLHLRKVKKVLHFAPAFIFIATFCCLCYVFVVSMEQHLAAERKQIAEKLKQMSFYSLNDTIVNPHDFSVLMQPLVPCLNVDKNSVYLVILVTSIVGREKQREVIRTTWASHVINKETRWPNVGIPKWARPELGNVKIYFLFGTDVNSTWHDKLESENKKYGDIIQEDFIDTYHNLTIKSVMGLKWAVTNCKGAKYVMKVDDDVFVNMPNLLKFLEESRPTDVIGGRISKRSPAWRVGKWKISEDSFPFKRYPYYAVGCSYVMGLSVAEKLYNASLYVPPVYLEDVYVTGMLAKICGIGHINHPGFWFSGLRPPGACRMVKSNVITATNWKRPEEIANLWKQLWDIDHSRGKQKC
ncbi:beta-1,3-galactosyltransferase 1-like isoform X2 [Lineus longissimus]